MAGGIVYLDIDDEITSAASRVRDVPGRRVALVLPYGSRVATSRINFRLLSRDALINEKQLSVVAGDSATRALAASAGLPVFASVAEYEGSLAGVAAAAAEVDAEPTVADAEALASAPAAPVAEANAASAPPAPSTPSGRTRRGSAKSKAPHADGGTEVGFVTGVGAVHAAAGVKPAGSEAGDQAVLFDIPREPSPRRDRLPTQERLPSGPPAAFVPQTRPGSRRGSRLPLTIGLAVLGLVVLVGGVGAYVLLPSATIVVTPRAESLAPLELTVTADPKATAPDSGARVVPAAIVSLEVMANDTFPATGKRVEETAATGIVRFSNLDFLRTNTIPSGSIVSTNAGVRFRTAATVTVPRADLVGLTVFPGRKNVTVTAVEPGTAGNVEPNTIVIVPKGEDPQALKVVNPDATSGGTREEFPRVAQQDIDAAMEQLTAALSTAFQARLADPSIASKGATVFSETATLGEPTPTVDPATLVDQEVESFELGLTATGSVVTVDPAPVSVIADELLRATVEPGYELVADSIRVKVGKPLVSGQSVVFSTTATGRQIAILDPDDLRKLVLGKPLDDARAILARYGDVVLVAWPDWVSSVPTIDSRVDLRVEGNVPVETPAPTESTS